MQVTVEGVQWEVTLQVNWFEAAEISSYPESQVKIATSFCCVPFHWSEPPETPGTPQSAGTGTHTCPFWGGGVRTHTSVSAQTCVLQSPLTPLLVAACIFHPVGGVPAMSCKKKKKSHWMRLPVTATTTAGTQRQHHQQHLSVNCRLTALFMVTTV